MASDLHTGSPRLSSAAVCQAVSGPPCRPSRLASAGAPGGEKRGRPGLPGVLWPTQELARRGAVVQLGLRSLRLA